MKKCLFALSLAVCALFCSCGKQCVCTTTYMTLTVNESVESEMGRMSDKDCAEYNGSYNDSEGVLRTVTCVIE